MYHPTPAQGSTPTYPPVVYYYVPQTLGTQPQMPVPAPIPSQQKFMNLSHLMDRILWDIEDNAQDGTIDSGILNKVNGGKERAFLELKAIYEELEVQETKGLKVEPQINKEYEHVREKYNRLRAKISSLTPVGPTVSPSQFQRNTSPPLSLSAQHRSHTHSPRAQHPSHNTTPSLPLPIGGRQVSSFTITPSAHTGQAASASLAPQEPLSRISYLLRHGNETQALQEFNQLSQDVQQAVYGALWHVRGRPMSGNPIAHDNFGEVSFKNLEARCNSTPMQKACAVELVNLQAPIYEMIALLGRNDVEGAKKIFMKLPPVIQNGIYGKHWEVCGKPTDASQDESLRKIAHPDFGRVSFLGLESRCDVSAQRKIETLKAFLPSMVEPLYQSQQLIDQTILAWKGIDAAPKTVMSGQQKTERKKDSLHNISKTIVLQLLGNDTPFQMATSAISRTTGQPGMSFPALAAAYVEKYPCLKPFILQLVDGLTLANEQQQQPSQTPTQGDRKSSRIQDPGLQSLGRHESQQYRVGIINETLDTLQKGHYTNSKGELVTLDLTHAAASVTCMADNGGHGVRRGSYNTQLFLDKKDCLTVTRDCAERGLNPIVVDAASDGHFGGGYKHGAGAQEENMCRRGGLSFAVDTAHGLQQQNFYPLSSNGEHAGLYVSNVPVFRGEEGEGYPYLDKPFETAVAVVAAYNFGPKSRIQLDNSTGESRIPKHEAIETQEKLRTVFEMAIQNGHDSVVLVALGCGAFANPPKHISEMMMELITEEFPHSFKEIHIAIIEDKNSMRGNSEGNFKPFKETIENGFLGKLRSIGMTYRTT